MKKPFWKITKTKIAVAVIVLLLPWVVVAANHIRLKNMVLSETYDETYTVPLSFSILSSVSNLVEFPFRLLVGRPLLALGVSLFGDSFYFYYWPIIILIPLSLFYGYLLACIGSYLFSLTQKRASARHSPLSPT